VTVVEKKRISVEINGSRYTLGGTEEEKYYYSLAQHVDQSIKEIKQVYPHINATDAAVMTALNITDELFKLRAESEEMKKQLEPAPMVDIEGMDAGAIPKPEKIAPKDAFIPRKNLLER
jgi:Uncharacterized protein conserved in bacteria